MMMVRGVRGATTIDEDTPNAIHKATQELLATMVEENDIEEEYVASIMFTTTQDLTSAYPAKAAREIGWQFTPLMGAVEMNKTDGLKHCIRILIHWNTEKSLQEINHVYLNGAANLRPDLKKEKC